jgi:hypothetical protein
MKNKNRSEKMSCRFCSHNGKCILWAEDAFDHIMQSCNDEGYCLVEEDENPGLSCEDYEK